MARDGQERRRWGLWQSQVVGRKQDRDDEGGRVSTGRRSRLRGRVAPSLLPQKAAVPPQLFLLTGGSVFPVKLHAAKNAAKRKGN